MNSDPQAATPDDVFHAQLAKARRVAMIAGVIGGAIGVCLAVAYFLQAERPNLRGTIGLPIVGAVGAAGMVMGLVLLFAPSTFFTSPQGQEYLKQIGTRSVIGARIVIGILLLIGCVFIGLFVFLGIELLSGKLQ